MKNFKNSFLGSVLIIVVAVLLFMWAEKAFAPEKKVDNEPEVVASKSLCGFTVVSPSANEILGSHIEIKAIVDNTKMKELGCAWGAFEAQAGTVIASDLNGKVVGKSILTTGEEWMTVEPVNYVSTLDLSEVPEGYVRLTFIEDNTADFPNPDNLVVDYRTN